MTPTRKGAGIKPSNSLPKSKLSDAEQLKRFCKAHKLKYIEYADFADLRQAVRNDQPSIVERVMKKCSLSPASRPYHPLAFSRLEQNFNTILHFVMLHCSTQVFALMQVRCSEGCAWSCFRCEMSVDVPW